MVKEHLFKALNNASRLEFFQNASKLRRLLRSTKKGDYSDPENYCPISLLSSLSKVFEKQLYNRMVNFSVMNEFTPVQFGFRSDHSFVHAISEITFSPNM